MIFASFRYAWRDLTRFKSVALHKRSIVFYAQDLWAWKHFEPIVKTLLDTHGKHILYVTSNARDPILMNTDGRIQSFYVGLGHFRTSMFQSLNVGVLVMTMPDFGTYYIGRSKFPVHYLYVHHSMVSCHMAYRPSAFDNFDSIMCVGPHHRDEIRAAEKQNGLKPKILVDAGYGIVDSILAAEDSSNDDYRPVNQGSKRILVAPSWGEQGLIETRGREIVEVLLNAGHKVTVRPHYMTTQNHPKLLVELNEQFGTNPNFVLDTDFESLGTVHSADIMISDWSGAALEFAFGLERPVLFVDVPRKVNNPDYENIGYEPIEVHLRSQIGEVISPDRLSEVPAALNRLCENPERWQEIIRKLRARWLYNVGTSAKVSADYIAQVAAAPGHHQ